MGFVLGLFVCLHFLMGPKARAPQNCLKKHYRQTLCSKGRAPERNSFVVALIMVRKTLLMQTFPVEQGKEFYSRLERNFPETSAPECTHHFTQNVMLNIHRRRGRCNIKAIPLFIASVASKNSVLIT